jgi:hypothetical protein
MANDEPRKQRPFILAWRSAVLNTSSKPATKLALLGLAEFADVDGTGACVSMEEIAALTGQCSRTVRQALKVANEGWFVRQAIKAQGQAWATYRYTLRLPEGAATVSARHRVAMRKGAEALAAPLDEGAAAVAAGDRQPLPQLPPEGAAAVAAEVGEAEEKRGKKRTRGARATITWEQWISSDTLEAEHERADHLVNAYCQKVGIPSEYGDLFVEWVTRKFRGSGKRQADWPATIRNYLSNGWARLWGIDPTGAYYLTTAGKQLQIELAAEARRAA